MTNNTATWHGAIHKGFEKVTSMIYSTPERIGEEEVVEEVLKVAGLSPRHCEDGRLQHTLKAAAEQKGKQKMPLAMDAFQKDSKETKTMIRNQLKEHEIVDLSLTEESSEEFLSKSALEDDGSFSSTSYDEGLSAGGEAQERAWQSLPESVQKQLKALTPVQRHRAFAVVAVIIVLVFITGISVTATRSASAFNSNVPMIGNTTPASPASSEEPTPTPTEYPTQYPRPTQWYTAMTVGPTINIQDWVDGQQQEMEEPSRTDPPTTATKAPFSPVYYPPLPSSTTPDDDDTIDHTSPGNSPSHVMDENGSTPYPTISLHAESVTFNQSPTLQPSERPLETWTQQPTQEPPTASPSPEPTSYPTYSSNITYVPGVLTHEEHGLLLSHGLRANILAKSGEFVTLFKGFNGESSTIPFHERPDAGATFADIRPWNQGGMVYVSNAEVRFQDGPGGFFNGGVGALTFDKNGQIIDYSMVLDKTTWNCGGGKTPWNTWVSCEETPQVGQCYQVSPFGLRESEVLTLGKDGGRFESFAHDVRNPKEPHFFITEDHRKGALQRFTPDFPDWMDPWSMLHGNGTIDFLVLTPNNDKETGGTFRWTQNRELAKNNARSYYPHTEGIDSHGSQLYFVSKELKKLYELNLDDMTYTTDSTAGGLFDGAPDQLQRIMKTPGMQPRQYDNLPLEEQDILYFTEEDGKDSGVHGRNANGDYFTILESPVYHDEVTGLAFSPDGMRMYFAYQVDGVLFEVYREDGRPFHAKALDVKYHGGPAIDVNEEDDDAFKDDDGGILP